MVIPDNYLEIILGSKLKADAVKQVIGVLENAKEFSQADPQALENAIKVCKTAICPPPCTEIDSAFYETAQGKLLAEAEYYLLADDLITLVEAARLLYGDSDRKMVMRIDRLITAGKLTAFARPNREYTAQRKSVQGKQRPPRSRLVRRSEVEQLKAENTTLEEKPADIPLPREHPYAFPERSETMFNTIKSLGPGWHAAKEIAQAMGKNRLTEGDVLVMEYMIKFGMLIKEQHTVDSPIDRRWEYKLNN